MEEKIKTLLEGNKKLELNKKPYYLLPDSHPEQTYFYEVNGFEGNEGMPLRIRDDEDFEMFEKIIGNDFKFVPEYLGVEYSDKMEFLLSPVNSRTRMIGRRLLRTKPVELELNYFKNKLEIEIQFKPEESLLSDIVELIRGRFSPIILTIKNYNKVSEFGKENDLRNILNCVLFDFGYSYNLIFEPSNIDSINQRTPLL